jgi:hypothetical protein
MLTGSGNRERIEKNPVIAGIGPRVIVLTIPDREGYSFRECPADAFARQVRQRIHIKVLTAHAHVAVDRDVRVFVKFYGGHVMSSGLIL